MILTGWEVSKNTDSSYRAAERKMGKDGYGVAVDQLTGHNLNGTLEEIQTELARWRMRPSKKLPKLFDFMKGKVQELNDEDR